MSTMITEVTSVSSKGQVVLPKSVREVMALNPGSKLIVISDGSNIFLKPISTPDLSEFDSLMEESKNWAKSVGMKKSEIGDAIKAVRKGKKAK